MSLISESARVLANDRFFDAAMVLRSLPRRLIRWRREYPFDRHVPGENIRGRPLRWGGVRGWLKRRTATTPRRWEEPQGRTAGPAVSDLQRYTRTRTSARVAA